jgi:hypothetical protein
VEEELRCGNARVLDQKACGRVEGEISSFLQHAGEKMKSVVGEVKGGKHASG